MKLAVVMLILCMCVATLARFLPSDHNSVEAVSLDYIDDESINTPKREDDKTSHTEAINKRSKRSFVIYNDCPVGQKRLPFKPPLNRCVTFKEYDQIMSEDDSDNIY